MVTSPVLDLAARYGTQAGAAGSMAAQSSLEDARDVVVLVVGNLYLRAVAGQARIETVRAQLTTAEALYQRAADMKKAGVVPAIERASLPGRDAGPAAAADLLPQRVREAETGAGPGHRAGFGQQFELAGRLSYSPRR